jgi:hypothetical protein
MAGEKGKLTRSIDSIKTWIVNRPRLLHDSRCVGEMDLLAEIVSYYRSFDNSEILPFKDR